MKKRKFDAKAMRKFTTEPKVVHESKPVDLITQYNRMRSIAADIYNSDFFMISSKAEQKKIEASIACISATMISMIGMEAINNSHDCLPDDSGDGTGTDKDTHDAIKKMMNIAYGKTKSDGVKKAAARLALNSVHGAPSHIMAMNRRILSELGIKSPADKPDEDPFTFGNEYDEVTDDDSNGDEVKDYSEVNLGNFIDGQQYLDICRQYSFDAAETLKKFEKVASQYYIQMINLVDVVDSRDEITANKYTLEPGSVFFITNKNDDKDPVFVLICAKSHIESFKIDKVSVKIKPVDLEESTKTNYIEFINSDAYFNIGKVHMNPNTIIDLDATLAKIKEMAKEKGIKTITFVDTINEHSDLYNNSKYSLDPGSLFFVKEGYLRFILINKTSTTFHYIDPVVVFKTDDSDEDSPDSKEDGSHDVVDGEVEFEYTPYESHYINDLAASFMAKDDIEFVGIDAYYNISKVHSNSNDVIDLDATLSAIKAKAKEFGIKTVTFVDTITDNLLAHFNGEYSMEAGSLFCVKDDDWTHFLLITKSGNLMSDIRVQYIYPVLTKKDDSEEDDIEFAGGDAYYKIDKACPNSTIIDLDATLAKIKEMAKEKGIKTITFVDSIDTRSEIFNKNKYSLEVGSLFFVKKYINLVNFILVTETGDAPSDTRIQVIKSVTKSVEDNSDSKEDDIEFIGIDDYYNIDKAYPNSYLAIDLDATLAKIKEKAKEKNIKTITFAGIIKGFYEIFYKGKYYQAGSLFYTKNDERTRFILITGTIDYVNLPQYEHIDPVVVFKTDDSEDESDSKDDGIEAVEAEDEIVDSDEASSDYGINDQYADVDTSELHPDIYAKVTFPIFMKPTDTGTDVSFAQICDLYDFDISETVKRIKNAAYLEKIEKVNYVDSFQTFDDIFKTEMSIRYGYHDGSLFLVRESTKGKLDPCFVILRKVHDDSYYDAYLYRINPIMRPAKIHGIKKIDIIDTYADGDVRIANDLKNLIDIDHSYKLKEICDKRNYDYDRISSCLKGVTAIIGGGTCLTFEGTVDSLNSIVSVDPVVAYKTCSVFFISGFVDSAKGPYFVIYMPITGKTKNGYNFRLYRIYPIPNLNQDPNTDSQDDSNVREINQFTAIYRANLEVSEADKDAYMKVEFSLINHSANRAIDSLQNICYTWKFKFYDTIKRIRFVAYMNNLKEIKFAGTACSHEEILEKEVLYSNGSVVFVSDAEDEDPHFVIVEFVDGSTCLNRINPVKE